MRITVLFILSLFAFRSYSQKIDAVIVDRDIANPIIQFPQNIQVKNSAEAYHYLKSKLDKETKLDFILVSEINSLAGIHYTFIQTFNGFEIQDAVNKINTDKKGNIITLFNPNISIESLRTLQTTPHLLHEAENMVSGTIKESKMKWVWIDSEYKLCYSLRYLDEARHFQEINLDQNLEIVQHRNLNNHLCDVDTTARGMVFMPNPLVSAETVYGGDFLDNNDAASPALNAQRITVDLELIYENDTFYLENPYVKIVDNSYPNISPTKSHLPLFNFDRSQNGFEDVNAFYHITTYQHFLQSLGFTNLVDYQIEVDCHALNGADNSLFNFGTNPHSIEFGEGGVDDAEDADVIIHEYTHAIMQSASPNTNFGTERGSIDEAFGDYLAVSYSKTLTNYQDNWVFRWDGHNEYWNGREVVSSKKYPNELQYSLYADAPLWSAALMQIEQNLGREVTTTIALESAYNYSTNMTMAQAAEIFLSTDTLLNNGVNANTMCWIFKYRGMINDCADTRPIDLVGQLEVEESKTISITNSEAFYLGNGNLVITSDSPFEIFVYDVSGKLVHTQSINKTYTELLTHQFQSGAYILKVVNETEVKTLKLTHQ